MAPITINGNTIDPDVSGTRDLTPSAKKSPYLLLQTTCSLSLVETRQLEAKGIHVLRLEGGENTYLCNAGSSDQSKLVASFVKKAILYHPDFVVDPVLKAKDLQQTALGKLMKPGLSKDGSPLLELEIVIHDDSTATGDTIMAELKKLLPTDSALEQVDTSSDALRAWVPIRLLDTLAAMSFIAGIFPAGLVEFSTVKALELVGCAPFNANGPQPQYLGRDQNIAVADSGLDKGKFSNLDDQPPALRGRIINTKKPGFLQRSLEDDHAESHGTHVAGSIAGLYVGQHPDSKVNVLAGPAREANIFVQRANPYGKTDFKNLIKELDKLRETGVDVRIQNNSWGNDTSDGTKQIGYAPYGEVVDKAIWNDGMYLIVFSAANGGESLAKNARGVKLNQQIGDVAAAKNCLTVGATWNSREMKLGTGNIEPIFQERFCIEGLPPPSPDPPQKEMAKSVAFMSSKGPTSAGFLKPDLVAPGVGVLSAWSRAQRPSNTHPRNVPDKGGYEDNYVADPLLGFLTGTSQATPIVTGIAACLRGAYMERRGNAPRGVTLKAMLINGADSCRGSNMWYVTGKDTCVRGVLGDPPDCIQGYGQVNYTRALNHVLEADDLVGVPANQFGHAGCFEYPGLQSQDGSASSASGSKGKGPATPSTANIIFYPRDIDTKIFVTMAYNDRPGDQLQHDLSLTLHLESVSKVSATDPVEVATRSHDQPRYYPAFTEQGSSTAVHPGNVRKASWVNFKADRPPLPGNMQYRVRIEVAAQRITPATDTVPFSVCWLCER